MNFSIRSLMSSITEKIEPVKKYLTAQTVILEGIPLELTNEFSEDLSSEIPVTKLDDGSNKTDNISNNPSSFSIKAQITGADKDRIYEKIISLVKKNVSTAKPFDAYTIPDSSSDSLIASGIS